LAGDFRPAETAADADADTLGPGLHRRIHPLLEHAAEAGALLELLGDGLGDELAVEVRVLDLDDLHGRDFALDQVLDLFAQLVDFRTLGSDDQARPRGLEGDGHLFARALDLDVADRGERRAAIELLIDVLADELVLNQELTVS